MIAIGDGTRDRSALPVTALVSQIENGLVARDHGDDDISAVARAIRAWSGLED